jgi:hypothetical protein
MKDEEKLTQNYKNCFTKKCPKCSLELFRDLQDRTCQHMYYVFTKGLVLVDTNFVGCAYKIGKFILFRLEVNKSINRIFQMFVLQKRPRIVKQVAKCS